MIHIKSPGSIISTSLMSMCYICLMKLLMLHFFVLLLYQLDDLYNKVSTLSLENHVATHC